MRVPHRIVLAFLTTALAFLLSLGSWVWWGGWPGPSVSGKVTDPAIIVVLGGGDDARARETARLATRFPNVPILVTGDSGFIRESLLAFGIPASRIPVEPNATSTWENAVFSKPWVDAAGDGQLVLVSNDFHIPRARAVFRKFHPDRRIVVACEPTPPPWDKLQQEFRRRERAAAIYYAVRYGVWSW